MHFEKCHKVFVRIFFWNPSKIAFYISDVESYLRGFSKIREIFLDFFWKIRFSDKKSYSCHRNHIPDTSRHSRHDQNLIWITKMYLKWIWNNFFFFWRFSRRWGPLPREGSLFRLRRGVSEKLEKYMSSLYRFVQDFPRALYREFH